jgi:hypothetical protein
MTTNSALLHIGYHKTASTWFQKNFYPRITSHTYIDRITARNALLFDHAYSFNPHQARRTLQGTHHRPLILCDEDLCGNFHSAGLYGGWTIEVARRLAATFPQADIVLIIREQKALLSSIYKQYIREGGTHRPYRYFHPYAFLPRRGFQPAKVALFSFEHFHYPGLIQLYQELFGKNKVHVFLYEEFRQDHLGFVTQFCQQIGLECDSESISWQRQNISYQRSTLALARLINHFTWRDVVDKRCWLHVPGIFQYSHKWLRSLNKRLPLGGALTPEQVLGSNIIQEIDQLFCSDNQWLMQHLNLPLQKYGYSL